MENKFVKVEFEIHCDWEGLPPAYRVYVNDELFSERTFRLTNQYLEEMLQISAPPGEYTINFQPIEPNLAKFRVKNMRVTYGPGQVENRILKIQ